MTKRTILAPAALAFALAACGASGEPGGLVTKEQVAERAADIVKPDPGLYRATAEVLQIDVSNAPPEMEAQLKGASAAKRTQEFCLTPQDADQGFEEAIRRGQQGDCTYRTFDVAGGKIDADMICSQGNRSVNVAMTGTVARTGTDLVMTVKMDMPGLGNSTVRTRAITERIGACPA